MEKLPKVCVIGGMNIDILAYPDSEIIMRDSNIGHVSMRPGGVGRNIALMLSSLGCSTGLMTALGTGDLACMLDSDCKMNGIDLGLSVKTELQPSVYMAVHDSSGDMLVAVNDMDIMSCITPELIHEKAKQIDAYDMCAVDANLSEAVLRAVIKEVSIPVIIDPVSTEKAMRCLPVLNGLYAIKPNLMEARTMTGKNSADECASALRQIGVRNVFISMGKDGVYYDGGSEHGFLGVQNVITSSQTGAGDAMLAGLIISMYQQKSPSECAKYAQKTAFNYLTRKNEKN